MIKNIKSLLLTLFVSAAALYGCKQTEYSFGEMKAPADLTLTAAIAGVDANNPNGNGSGAVQIITKAQNAISYRIDFGDGSTQMVPSGTINYKYTNPGTYEYTITANVIGTGGTTSTVSKKIKVFVAFEIPPSILAAVTGGSSKIWITDKETSGHVGVGPAAEYSPIWYSAAPNERSPCLYDDEITFSKDANNNIFMNVDNKGQSSVIGASSAFYGFSGGDGCYGTSTGGNKKLAFMNATSASTPANSTRIQFMVPGNGLVNFGTGGNTYEIMAITATTMTLRNIGIDGNAWYQKLKVK